MLVSIFIDKDGTKYKIGPAGVIGLSSCSEKGESSAAMVKSAVEIRNINCDSKFMT